MSKKIIKLLSVGLISYLLFATPVFANAQTLLPLSNIASSTEIEMLDNGDYITTTMTEYSDISSTRSANTKTGSKTVTYRNSNDDILWSFTVTGTFSYNGTTSSCTKSTCSYNIKSSAWKNPSTSSSKSGNTASGTITIKQYRLGLAVNSITRTVNLSCNKNGVLS